MAQMETILVVEDEAATRTMVVEYLRDEGYEVREAENIAQGREALQRGPADIVLLDINLPDGDGLSVGRELRAKGETGLIFVTRRDSEVDRVVGLELGGDDYVVKPINLRELLARVRSVLRRRRSALDATSVRSGVRTFGGWLIDLTRRELSDPVGEPVRLTRGEFDLLAALVHGGGRPITRDYLIEVVTNSDADTTTRTVDTLVSRLRRKVEPDPRHPEMIVTVQGVGYKLAVPVD